jgi:hypothetical protein
MTSSQWIEVPVNGNKLDIEVPNGFAMAGGSRPILCLHD